MAMALSIISAVGGAIGQIQQANAKASADEFNAKVEDRKAEIAKANAVANEQTQRRKTAKLLGTSRANIGASGITVAGTPLRVLAETAALGELDALNIRFGGDVEAQGFQSNAALDRASATNTRNQGLGLAAGTLFGGIGTAIRRA